MCSTAQTETDAAKSENNQLRANANGWFSRTDEAPFSSTLFINARSLTHLPCLALLPPSLPPPLSAYLFFAVSSSSLIHSIPTFRRRRNTTLHNRLFEDFLGKLRVYRASLKGCS